MDNVSEDSGLPSGVHRFSGAKGVTSLPRPLRSVAPLLSPTQARVEPWIHPNATMMTKDEVTKGTYIQGFIEDDWYSRHLALVVLSGRLPRIQMKCL